MFNFLMRRPPVCPVCHEYMVAVDVRDVPDAAKREFARMNKWVPLSLSGWYACLDCYIHIHQPTVDKSRKPYR